MARLAFICSVQPGASDDSQFFVALAAALKLQGPDEISIGDKSAYRRAWFESSTVAIAEVRSKIEATTEDAPKKMPKEERSNRYRLQQNRLGGIKIEGQMEPSHSLLDKVWAMRENDALAYLPLEECTSRSQEILGIKRESFLKAEPSGAVKQVHRDINPTADLTTEYRVKLAFTRRSLAFDSCELCEFSKMEDLHDFLYSLVMKEALDTHQPISVSQIIKADRQLMVRLIELTRDGIVTDSNGRKPIETLLPVARMDPLFNAILQPLPRVSYNYDKAHVVKPFSDAQASVYGKSRGKEKGSKGKGKGRGKVGKGPSSSMPEELRGLRQQTRSGGSYCWGFNMGAGCNMAKPGAYCTKGLHSCMKCGSQQHGAAGCDKK